ncbi:hypothetical protein [Blastococcus sp. PRF04-17]|uniref:hypothetical protein n=1 Tax=Blastococcus sp. PRF04-17 TaxID=2933797 RepID=UPI001FF3C055|nr:hypothetical protein [Blastococcus sp. PRF04-17]UOY03660.1 hypothetical protein MVA48_10150 [Blastococcus sp. PRF04-17]
MTSTTVRSTPSTDTVARRARSGAIGGGLWLLLPAVWAAAELGEQEFGSLGFVAVAVADWIFLVLAPVLIVVGHTALRASLGPGVSRIGRTGVALGALGLGAVAVGNGIEVGSMSLGGGEVAVGHAIFLVGFLVSIVGGVLVGSTVVRRFQDVLARTAGWLLVLALPLGAGIGFLGSMLAPENDAAFWAAISVPTGAAWLLLGRYLLIRHRGAADVRA